MWKKTTYLGRLSFRFFFEYKATFLCIRPNFTIVTPGELVKGSVTIELQLNFTRVTWHSQKD